MKRLTIYAMLICIALLTACAKQQPTDKPGTALIANFKTGLTVTASVITTVRIGLPAFRCPPNPQPNARCLDADDEKAASSILNDVATARDSFDARLAPYDHFDSGNADEIKQAARDTLATLKDLHEKQVDHMKNPRTREIVDAAFSAAEKIANELLKTTPPAAI